MTKKNEIINAIREFLIKEGLYMYLTQRADTVIYPAHADIDLAIYEEPDAYNRDALKLLLDSLLKAMANYPEHFTKDGYAPLHVIAATAFIPNHRQLLDYLVMRGVLERVEVAVGEGGLEYAYRFSPAYETSRLKEERLESAAVIEAAVSVCLGNLSGLLHRPELSKFYLDGGLEIDESKAIQAFQDYYVSPIYPDDPTPYRLNVSNNVGQLLIYELKSKQWRFEFNRETGFLRTTLSHLSQFPMLKPSITYGGHRLVEIEVLDSKIIMLIALLDYSFWGFESGFAQFLHFVSGSTTKTLAQATEHLSPEDELTMSYNEYIERGGIAEDPVHAKPTKSQNLFLGEMEGGDIYLNTLYATSITPLQAETLISLFRLGRSRVQNKDFYRLRKLVSAPDTVNDILKLLPLEDAEALLDTDEFHFFFDKVLFDKNYAHGDRFMKLRAAFKNRFPAIFVFTEWLNKKDTNLLSNLLNRMEAHFLVERVCKVLMVKDETVPFFPIMSRTGKYSLLTVKGAEDIVMELVRKEIRKISTVDDFLRCAEPWEEGHQLT
ncbi:hypothetical protein [Pontibacter russatus]|uniref:hypothetical protein n=1 Tax=Pontibacter russatus TaxID=2694929 RepID=UPI001379D4B6|nr:hypothetical protein [Pontibacter russatus]